MSTAKLEVTASSVTTLKATMLVKVEGAKNARTVICADTDVPEGLAHVKLEWEMDTEGWGILGIHGLGEPEFIGKSKHGNGFKCTDKNNISDEYEYTVIVGRTSTKEVAVLDPTIKNGGN